MLAKKLTAVVLVGALLLLFSGCIQPSTSKGPYADGEYHGEAPGHGGPLKVKVTIVDGRISEIDIIEHHESPDEKWPDSGRARVLIPQRVLTRQSTEGIDVVSKATGTSLTILKAVSEALQRARK
ncbi:MAG: FMN-binding protein [Bacillota bacterium]